MATALAVVERDAFAAAGAHFGGMVDYLKSREAGELTESDLERRIEEQIRELARRLIQAHLETPTQRGARPRAGRGGGSGPWRGRGGTPRQRGHARACACPRTRGEDDFRQGGGLAPGLRSRGRPEPASARRLAEPAKGVALTGSAPPGGRTSGHAVVDETVASLERQIGTEVGKRQVEELVQRAGLRQLLSRAFCSGPGKGRARSWSSAPTAREW